MQEREEAVIEKSEQTLQAKSSQNINNSGHVKSMTYEKSLQQFDVKEEKIKTPIDKLTSKPTAKATKQEKTESTIETNGLQSSGWNISPIPTSSPVSFPLNSSYPTPAFKQFLDTVATLLQNISWSSLIIYGNADSVGSAKYNEWLSLKRADRVKTYLVNKNIPSEKISVVGNGHTKPISNNKTKEGRQMNRRIDLELQK
ncbi:MAG: OmpA family protein [Paludibacter sp.]|nr:OmpA family protein [Paludibacter sp.]